MGDVVRDPRIARRSSSPKARAGLLRNAIERGRPGGASMQVTSRVTVAKRLAVAILPLGVVTLWLWTLGAQHRAIERMPAAEQRAIYEQSIAAFRTTCMPPRDGLVDHCREQAAFLSNFAQCESDCRAALAPFLRIGSR